jgi:hypothetical protein
MKLTDSQGRGWRRPASTRCENAKNAENRSDGKLQNIGAFARFVTGTWNAGTQKGEFKIVRN